MITDQAKEDEMSRTCSTIGGEAEYIQTFGEKASRKETTRKTQS
jgi:hypothetical protein